MSNGTPIVLLDSSTVDFHTPVRDLAWSPDGSRAAFIDGNGNLVVSRPDGTGQVTVAENPGRQTWSHPSWQVVKSDPDLGNPAKNRIFLTVDQGGSTTLAGVPADATGATVTPLSLNAEGAEDNAQPLPKTGNVWPNVGGSHGTAVYANTGDGLVYIRDDSLRQQGGKLTQGSEPALSPDEHEVVFVRSVEGHDHLFALDLDTQNPQPRDLTPQAATDYTEPAWAPSGKEIAARTPDGIVLVPADGSHTPKPTVATPGLPAYRP
ncbi:hypothetical protein C7C46_10040 [Streptomyces tateyamensis]|uniref:Uncharacterized protein n=1 Tax=Streptomyces tateyamensis TaxID=565073 RepID=A0A2V4P0B1_9ACTN|nr:PD40 domain-containing protein [Streptomyces tateyamensis]PYC82686.1 hypothetical protein C7C46_10040 [Streptomyces tateyamensis]